MNNNSSSREEYTMDIQPTTFVVPEWSVGDRIRKMRETLGVTRYDIEERSEGEISFKMMGNYETGLTIPKNVILREIARLLPADYEWLKTGKAPSDPQGPDGGIPNNVTRLPGLDSNQEPIG
jgi:transcriptional regulator with XRE-family HTH domain